MYENNDGPQQKNLDILLQKFHMNHKFFFACPSKKCYIMMCIQM